jgi:hypothetical protein
VLRYRCPYCEPRPLRRRRRRDGVWICARCGDPLKRRLPLWPVPVVGGLQVTLGLAVATQQPGSWFPAALPTPQVLVAPVPQAPQPAGLEGVEPEALLARLATADAAWTPRADVLPDGRIRYLYKRRQGEAELSVAEIKDLMANPPSFAYERAAIAELLTLLGDVGIRIQLSQPLKAGAAAEWDPRLRTLRVKPSVLESGSREFAQVLNHEAIHVAQSCRGGGITAQPQPLGLTEELPPTLQRVLQEPVYRQASEPERRLEREAYASQHLLELGGLLVRTHCRLAG